MNNFNFILWEIGINYFSSHDGVMGLKFFIQYLYFYGDLRFLKIDHPYTKFSLIAKFTNKYNMAPKKKI